MFRYALTIFVSAFLLFQVQPLIGRFILPWFGGGPSIWTGCMLFFQAALLGGYFYAHVLCGKLSLRSQARTHLAILAASVLLLPIAPSEAWKPLSDQEPLTRILLLLIVTVGGPYFVLASTGPLMQKWFSHTSPKLSPYRLYALSNIGSLLALVSYPFVFEPWLTLHHQVVLWTSLYLAFAISAGWCAMRVLRHAASELDAGSITQEASINSVLTGAYDGEPASPGMLRILLWLGLAACGSAVLLATTNQLCIDVATVPFLWILPLSLYLISFIICFDQPRWYDRRVFAGLLMVVMPLAYWALSQAADLDLIQQVVIFSAVLFACCMACHGELVQLRPEPRFLTLFYLMISAGGVLGGIFVAIFATYWFNGYWEYPISLVACCSCALAAMVYQRVWSSAPSSVFWTWFGGALAMFLAAIGLVWWPESDAFTAIDEVAMFGGLGILVLVGLISVGIDAPYRRWPAGWFGLAILPTAWPIAWGMWSLPEVMTPRLAGQFAGAAILGYTVGLGIRWGLLRLRLRWQSLLVRGLILAYAITMLVLAYQQRFISQDQAKFLFLAGLAGVVLDWIVGILRDSRKTYFGMANGLPLAALIGLMGFNFWKETVADSDARIFRSRNFYGVLNIEYEPSWEDDDEYGLPGQCQLTHGQILHGFQYEDEPWRSQPTSYYGRESGFGLAIELLRKDRGDAASIRVGVVGLGTGSIAAYGKQNDFFCFYEINPAVRDLSGRYFSYLDDTPADTLVKIGDARIVMEREIRAGQPQRFDLLVIDAFSSDAIPVHLLTTECGEIYREHVVDNGILAIHISNRFLDLGPVVRGLAESLGWHAVRIDNDDDDSIGVYGSTWVLLTQNPDYVSSLEGSITYDPWQADEFVLPWTDDYSGLWRILSL